MNEPTTYTTEELLSLLSLPQRVQAIMDTIKHATVCVQRQYVHVKGMKFEISSSYRTPTFRVKVHIPQETTVVQVVEIGSGLTADILTKIIENHASAEK